MPETKNPVTPKSAWVSSAYERAPWVREKHGEIIEPPNMQASNSELANENVLQERAEPVGKSAAFPLMGGLGDKQTGGISPTAGII